MPVIVWSVRVVFVGGERERLDARVGRVVRPVDAELKSRIEHTWQHYLEQAARHRAGRYPAALATR